MWTIEVKLKSNKTIQHVNSTCVVSIDSITIYLYDEKGYTIVHYEKSEIEYLKIENNI